MNYPYSHQYRITFISALFGLFFGVMTYASLLVAGMGSRIAVASGMIAFAVAMLAAHIFLSVQHELETRRYEKFEASLGESVRARYMANIFADNEAMGGMIYILKNRLVLASVGRRWDWRAVLYPGDMSYVKQLDSLTLQIDCRDGQMYRIVTMPLEDVIADLREINIPVDDHYSMEG